jgi:hypothetical protein
VTEHPAVSPASILPTGDAIAGRAGSLATLLDEVGLERRARSLDLVAQVTALQT